MKNTVKGPFQVKGTPQAANEATTALALMNMKFDKTFEGDLAGTSIISMMGMMNKELLSGGYVGLEKFEGTLNGKKGSFYLQHSSLMARGQQFQNIVVVPDTATEDLAGLKGQMEIEITEGKHFYTFNYELP